MPPLPCKTCGFQPLPDGRRQCPVCAASDKFVAYAASDMPPNDPSTDTIACAFLPELDQATVSHLCRTALVILHLSNQGSPSEDSVPARTAEGAKRMLNLIEERSHLFRLWWDRLVSDGLPATDRATFPSWARAVQTSASPAELSLWLEHGVFSGFTLAGIERTGAYLG